MMSDPRPQPTKDDPQLDPSRPWQRDHGYRSRPNNGLYSAKAFTYHIAYNFIRGGRFVFCWLKFASRKLT